MCASYKTTADEKLNIRQGVLSGVRTENDCEYTYIYIEVAGHKRVKKRF